MIPSFSIPLGRTSTAQIQTLPRRHDEESAGIC
jgi:hypothetical protein